MLQLWSIFLIRKISWDMEAAILKQFVDTLHIPLHCHQSRVAIKHKIFDETSDELLISRLASAEIGVELLLSPFQLLSLPKPLCFNCRTLLKLGKCCVNKMFQIIESSSSLGWKTRQCFNSVWSCWSLEKSYWNEEGMLADLLILETLSTMQLASVLIHVAFMPMSEPIKSPQKNLATAHPMMDFLLVCIVRFSALMLSITQSTTGWVSVVIWLLSIAVMAAQ